MKASLVLRAAMTLSVAATLLPSFSPATAAEPSIGGLAEGPVEYVATVPFDAGTAQVARIVGDHLFVSSWKHISIYDISDPLDPALVGAAPTGFQFPAERMDTNGKTLIIGEEMPIPRLHVWDVRDKAAPREIALLDGAGDHTFTCVLGCRWAYGAYGTIVDLRDPSDPKVAGRWDDATLAKGHDVTEVAPGRVVTSSMPTMRFLDARRNPASPKELAVGDSAATGSQGYIGTNGWPRSARDRFLLTSEETSFTPRCTEGTSTFATWDTSRWRVTRTFELADTFKLANGTYTDGNPPANAIGCSTHVFDAHPDFHDGGLVALAHYEHGTRFLKVARDGSLSETGWFMPWGGETSAAYWVTDDLVYAIDFNRGIDILRVTG